MSADPFQVYRMLMLWPLIVACVAFYAVRSISMVISGSFTKGQALLAGACAAMAWIVTLEIADKWDGSQYYWAAFTVGLGFVTIVLLVNLAVDLIKLTYEEE